MPRPPKKIDLAELERLAGLGLTVKEISWCLGINPDTFYENKKTKAEFSESIARGRSKAIVDCAQIVLDAAIKGKDVKSALAYLKRFADGWKDNPVEIQLEHQGQIVAAHKSNLDEKAQERMALTFLELRGFEITPPMAAK